MHDASRMVQLRGKFPRFGVGVLLALTACVASYMAGRKHGFDSARGMWTGLPKIQRIYNVHDLTSKKTDHANSITAAELSDLLQSEIWQTGLLTATTDYQVVAGPMAGTVSISANEISHKKTDAILARLRATRDK